MVVDAIRYVVDNGCKVAGPAGGLPAPPDRALLLRPVGRSQAVDDLHDALRDRLRERDGRDLEPSAAIVDSQSLRAAETVGAAGRGWDAGKKVNGTKRHVAVDTLGLLLLVLVTAASVQDRDGARHQLARQQRCRIGEQPPTQESTQSANVPSSARGSSGSATRAARGPISSAALPLLPPAARRGDPLVRSGRSCDVNSTSVELG